MNSLITRVIIPVLVFFFILNLSALGIEKKQPHKKEIYIGLNLPYNTIGSDFTGKLFLTAPTGEIIMVPKIDGAIGFGCMIGYRHIGANKTGYAVEASYQLTMHDYSWMGFTGDATFGIINFDTKGIYSSTPTDLYLLIGLAMPWIKVKDGAGLTTSGNNIGYYNETDAKYTGFGINIGGGAEIFLSPNVSLGGRAAYRWIRYSIGNGESGKFDISNGLGGSGMHISGMLTYHIPMK
jgi:hypothetical protein